MIVKHLSCMVQQQQHRTRSNKRRIRAPSTAPMIISASLAGTSRFRSSDGGPAVAVKTKEREYVCIGLHPGFWVRGEIRQMKNIGEAKHPDAKKGACQLN